MNRIIISAAALAAALLSGCANQQRHDIATPVDEIKPVPTSPLIYSHMTCAQISADLDALNNKESELVYLQKRRLYRDRIQRKFLKIGRGDGEEAAQLAAVRGKRDAANIALEKKCSFTPENPGTAAPHSPPSSE